MQRIPGSTSQILEDHIDLPISALKPAGDFHIDKCLIDRPTHDCGFEAGCKKGSHSKFSPAAGEGSRAPAVPLDADSSGRVHRAQVTSSTLGCAQDMAWIWYKSTRDSSEQPQQRRRGSDDMEARTKAKSFRRLWCE